MALITDLGHGELPRDSAELAALYVAPVTLGACGTEPGDGPDLVVTKGLEYNDFTGVDGRFSKNGVGGTNGGTINGVFPKPCAVPKFILSTCKV